METSVKTAEITQAKSDEDFSKDVKKIMDNRKFVEFLSTKMIALMETPELQRKIRNTSSNLLDKKEFDSKNLSNQAKTAIKAWAKEIVKSELVPQIEGKNYNYKRP